MDTSIEICGKKYNIGTKVVLWNKGLNAYGTSKHVTFSEDRRTGKKVRNVVSGKRYGKRSWRKMTLDQLKEKVTQFFLHHSGMYKAIDTFSVLHNERRLSVHFILDDDGTIYQTLDLAEKAWHGGKNNPVSIGIEIDSRAMADKFPEAYNEYFQKKHNVFPRKKRIDFIQGKWINGYDYNDKQYDALSKLGKALVNIFPEIKADFPRNKNGEIIKTVLSNPLEHNGFICHYNTNITKVDPICFDHSRFLLGVKKDIAQGPVYTDFNTWVERQQALLDVGFYPGKIDGVYGPLTRNALQKFQRKNCLRNNGEWNEKTNYMINMALEKQRIY